MAGQLYFFEHEKDLFYSLSGNLSRFTKLPTLRLVKLHRYTPQEIDLFVKAISDITEMTPGRIKLDVVENDPTDNKYLECAVESGAAYRPNGNIAAVLYHFYSDFNLHRNKDLA